MLSLVHVLEWRAAVTPGVIALSDQQGAEVNWRLAAPEVTTLLRLAGPAAGSATTGSATTGNGDAGPGFDGAAGFDTGALVSWARERLAGFKCPTGVTVVPELPRNATGKVLRAALRAPFWADRDRQVS